MALEVNVVAGLAVVAICLVFAWHDSRFFWNDDYQMTFIPVFEEVNPVFKSQASRVDALAEDWVGDFQQTKGDRVQFFSDYLPQGRYRITHLARVRAAGEATAPGTTVEEMYHPERFGFSGTSHVVTKAME